MATPFVSRGTIEKWSRYVSSDQISIPVRPLIEHDHKIFAMGSCFAEEIRSALSSIGMTVLPSLKAVSVDAARNRVDSLPVREHLNYYNTYTVRQELERIAGQWSPSEEDFWTTKTKLWPEGIGYQDPYRRLVLGRTPEDLIAVRRQLDRSIDDGFAAADAFLMTFGMTEVFVNRQSGRVVCQKPLYGGGGGKDETDFHPSTFEENLENVRAIVRLIRAAKPTAPIVLTVSPVGLERTFSGNDIFVANMESKSILRAVLGQVAREDPSVTYFPAYELVVSSGMTAFKPDGRHVKREVVHGIMSAFAKAHVVGAPDVPASEAADASSPDEEAA